MKELKLSQGLFAIVDDRYFDELNKYKWCSKKHRNTFYAIRNTTNENGRHSTILMHRVILGLNDPKVQVDHINCNGLDNSILNLRICNNSENQRNKRPYKGGSSKYKGVYMDKQNNKWRVSIQIEKKRINIGRFTEEIAAAKAYDIAAKLYFREFAKTNF
jgi:hypothetical protein